MVAWFRQLDDLLRGRKTDPQVIVEGRLDVPLRVFVMLALLLGASYGFFMGWFSLFGSEWKDYRQLLASTIKLPVLFLVTLIVTFPSLYVFNALLGCRLSFVSTLRLLVAAIVVDLAVVASLGPILGFFTVSTTSYPFMILLNVVLMAIGGLVGLTFLLHTLRRLALIDRPRQDDGRVVYEVHPSQPKFARPPGEDIPDQDETSPDASYSVPPELPRIESGPLDPLPKDTPKEPLGRARLIFHIWLIIYALIGAQTGWLLRPFIGNPGQEFQIFRNRDGNFFLSVMHMTDALFGLGWY